MKWIPELRPCPVCAQADYDLLGSRGGTSHQRRLGVETRIVRCRHCHAVYGRPCLIPDGNPYEEHSADTYFRGHESSSKTKAGLALANDAEGLIGRRGRILELGCGRGELLVGARRAGWTVRGVEMTDAFSAKASSIGLEIELARVESCQSLREQWDAVLLAAILEHLYEPRECLTRVFEALVPGGVAFIDVPNECSLWTRLGNAYMRIRGRAWAVNLSPTFPPYHVVGFCPQSLKYLAGAIGFEIVNVKTHRWRNDLPARNSWTGRLETLGSGAALTLGSWVGSGAGLTAWLRRPSDVIGGARTERSRSGGEAGVAGPRD